MDRKTFDFVSVMTQRAIAAGLESVCFSPAVMEAALNEWGDHLNFIELYEPRYNAAKDRIAELEAQAFQPADTVPRDGTVVELLAYGFIGDDGFFHYMDYQPLLRGWRPLRGGEL